MPEEVNTQTNTPNTPADASSAAADTNTAQTQETTPTADSGANEAKPENTATDQSAQAQQEPELTIDSYKELDSFDSEYELDADSMKAFKEMGLKNKISPTALKAVAEWSLGEVKKQQEAISKQRESWREENAKKYGDNLKNVQTNVGRVLAEIDKSGNFANLLKSAGAEEHPATLEFLNAISDVVLEKGSINPNATVQGKEMTLEDMYKIKTN